MLGDTQQRLTAWAHWVRSSDSGLRLGFSKVGLVAAGSVAMPECSDEEALAVDRAVARLLQRDPVMGEVLVMAYQYGFSLTRIARDAGIGSREKARYLLGAGEAWVDARLDSHDLIGR